MLALVAETKEGRSMLEAKLKEEQRVGDKNSFGHHFQEASLLDRLGRPQLKLDSPGYCWGGQQAVEMFAGEKVP